ncbi:hypothetical protein K8Q93_02625 [Candidatus Parcubacteria bacterium]|nr:hypothetical protein [Candidatus Parcubacteria bacterium]
MKRISTRTKLVGLVAAGFLLLGLAAYFYNPEEWSPEWALLSVAGLLFAEGAAVATVTSFLRGFVVRYGVMKLLPFILVIAVPILWRRAARTRFLRSSQKAKELHAIAWEYWQSLPWLLRLLLVGGSCVFMVIVALVAGSILGIVTIFGVRIAVSSSVMSWLWYKTIAFLARLALGKWVERNCSMVWNYLPEDKRARIRKRYRELWWLTLRRTVRRKLVYGRRARVVLEQHMREAARQRILGNRLPHPREHGIQ